MAETHAWWKEAVIYQISLALVQGLLCTVSEMYIGKMKEDKEEEEETQEKDPLEAANEQIEELKDKYLRAVAEFDNYKKRTLKEKTELILNGGEKTIVAILPTLMGWKPSTSLR